MGHAGGVAEAIRSERPDVGAVRPKRVQRCARRCPRDGDCVDPLGDAVLRRHRGLHGGDAHRQLHLMARRGTIGVGGRDRDCRNAVAGRRCHRDSGRGMVRAGLIAGGGAVECAEVDARRAQRGQGRVDACCCALNGDCVFLERPVRCGNADRQLIRTYVEAHPALLADGHQPASVHAHGRSRLRLRGTSWCG